MNLKQKFLKLKFLPWLLITVLVLFAGSLGGYQYYKYQNKTLEKIKIETQNINLTFLEEIYDVIKNNYWDLITDEKLTGIYKLGAEKIQNQQEFLPSPNKEGLKLMLNSILDTKTPKEQKDFAVQLGDMVLANLEPFGRSRLYTQKLQQNLVNTINNVDPSADLYSFLGVDATADEKKIKRAYQEKTSKLKKDKSPEAKTKLEQVERAFTALKTPARKQRYDEYKAEPTITHRQLNQKTYYIKIHKFSPIAYQELVEAFNAVNENNKTIDSLVLDLRGNIGGAIDLLPYFLGPFIGQNNYAFEYFSRGTSTPYKTLTDRLPGFARYKKIVILIDEQTQSSAEVMASTLKKYNVGVLVGSTTKGWGTIEKIFELKTQIAKDEKYSVFLVHTLTLGDKNQPIEGRGIQPMININTNDWETQLLKYFESGSLVNEIKKLYQK